jgi:hypothetical protein
VSPKRALQITRERLVVSGHFGVGALLAKSDHSNTGLAVRLYADDCSVTGSWELGDQPHEAECDAAVYAFLDAITVCRDEPEANPEVQWW